jgi:hypothetical protein
MERKTKTTQIARKEQAVLLLVCAEIPKPHHNDLVIVNVRSINVRSINVRSINVRSINVRSINVRLMRRCAQLHHK